MPELTDTHFAFSDIPPHNMEMVTQLCRRDIEANGLPVTVSVTTDRRAAVTEADYVLCPDSAGRISAGRIDVLKRFGYYSTESNGHLSEVRALVPQAGQRDP